MRRQPGNRYQVVCPIDERYSLGVFFREWVPISSEKASISWDEVTPNNRTLGYRDVDRYEVPYKNSFLRLEEARAEKVIGHSLNAKVIISAEGEEYRFLNDI